MTDYAFYRGLLVQALQENSRISALVANIFPTAPGEPPSDLMLGELQACIGIATQACVPQPLIGVAQHGNSIISSLVSFIITVQNIKGRDSESYASEIAGLIYDLFKGDFYQIMNNNTYQLVFRPTSWKITTLPDQNFGGNRANVKLSAEIKYFG
jgi:hypothetical protein